MIFVAIAVNVAAQAQSSERAAQAAHQWHTEQQAEILQQFTTLLSIPNVAGDHDNILRNAELLKSMLQKRGFDSRLLTLEGANPIVFGEIKTPNAKHTIVFYAHYDGQPLDPKEWVTPPFTPTSSPSTITLGSSRAPSA